MSSPASQLSLEHLAEVRRNVAGSLIFPDAQIGFDVGPAQRVLVGPDAKVGAIKIPHNSVILGAVGDGVNLSQGFFMLPGASLGETTDPRETSYSRTVSEHVSIGRDVVLDGQVQLGMRAIIPTQETIVTIGTFGVSNRFVTIYGSDTGPLFSVGCQFGIDHGTLKERIGTSEGTTNESARSYKPFINVFKATGKAVQEAYRDAAEEVAEIRELRKEFGIDGVL